MNFIEKLKNGNLLFDGGMGTEIYIRGVFINRCYEELNITNTGLINNIYQDYVNAGSDIISTNTFGANYFKLKKYSLQSKLYDINYIAAKNAKDIAGTSTYVAGSVGPLGIQVEPLGPLSRDEAKRYFQEHLKPLIKGGIDLILFETFINHIELEIAVEAAKEITELPIIAQLTIDDDGTTLHGASITSTIEHLNSLDAEVIGVNCTVGPRSILNWLEKARSLSNKYLSVMPNAGKPENINGRNIYLTSPEYLGEYAKHFAAAGADIIGGCCGTGPEHIKKMRNMLNSIDKNSFKKQIKSNIVTSKEIQEQIIPIEKKSNLGKSLQEGRFVKFVELLSPKGVGYENVLSKAKRMNEFGIDIINIPDGPRASARMSAASLAILIEKELGMETVLHFVCRDKNVIGIQSDLMGFYALGLRNILAITGDPPKLGSYPDATAVYDVDSIGLVNIIDHLNHGRDIANDPIGDPLSFTIGVGCNPGAIDLNKEIERLKWKIDAGAEYAVTQPVFDLEVFQQFVDKISSLNIRLIAGLWPLVSIRNAEFMNNEVPGVNIPKDIIEEMRRYEGDKEGSLRKGIDIASDLLFQIKSYIKGVQISAPFGKIETVEEILNRFPELR